jgi:hypothetical protein
MRRLISITACALFLAAPLCAQRGGGHVGGTGGHASFGGGRVGGFAAHSGGATGGGRFSGGMRTASGPVRSFSGSHPVFSQRPFLHDGFRGPLNGRVHFRTFGLRSPCGGFGCWRGYGYPWWGYDPWLGDWWNDDYSFDQDYYNNLARADEMNQQSLEQQRMWRQEEADGDQDAYDPNPTRPHPSPQLPAPSESQDPQPSPASRPTVLVFRDQHKEEIRNYAIVGQTLWNFARQGTERIAFARLDIPATIQANDERGIAFRVPTLDEGAGIPLAASQARSLHPTPY